MNDTVIPTRYYAALVRNFQANSPDLKVDGILGPKTRAALEAYITENTPKPPVVLSEGLGLAWDIAADHVGKGGDPGTNNVSGYIQTLRRLCGFPVLKEDGSPVDGPWCAVWVSAMLHLAGFPRELRSRGAYRLCENMVNHPQGFEITSPKGMVPGQTYLACWKRGRWDTHKEAHIRMLTPRIGTTTMVDYREGNGVADKVRGGVMKVETISRDLIMVVGWTHGAVTP